MIGYDVVCYMLDVNGFYDVFIEFVCGVFLDYYDLINWVVWLFEFVYYENLILVVFVVCYEVGYVI